MGKGKRNGAPRDDDARGAIERRHEAQQGARKQWDRVFERIETKASARLQRILEQVRSEAGNCIATMQALVDGARSEAESLLAQLRADGRRVQDQVVEVHVEARDAVERIGADVAAIGEDRARAEQDAEVVRLSREASEELARRLEHDIEAERRQLAERAHAVASDVENMRASVRTQLDEIVDDADERRRQSIEVADATLRDLETQAAATIQVLQDRAARGEATHAALDAAAVAAHADIDAKTGQLQEHLDTARVTTDAGMRRAVEEIEQKIDALTAEMGSIASARLEHDIEAERQQLAERAHAVASDVENMRASVRTQLDEIVDDADERRRQSIEVADATLRDLETQAAATIQVLQDRAARGEATHAALDAAAVAAHADIDAKTGQLQEHLDTARVTTDAGMRRAVEEIEQKIDALTAEMGSIASARLEHDIEAERQQLAERAHAVASDVENMRASVRTQLDEIVDDADERRRQSIEVADATLRDLETQAAATIQVLQDRAARGEATHAALDAAAVAAHADIDAKTGQLQEHLDTARVTTDAGMRRAVEEIEQKIDALTAEMGSIASARLEHDIEAERQQLAERAHAVASDVENMRASVRTQLDQIVDDADERRRSIEAVEAAIRDIETRALSALQGLEDGVGRGEATHAALVAAAAAAHDDMGAKAGELQQHLDAVRQTADLVMRSASDDLQHRIDALTAEMGSVATSRLEETTARAEAQAADHVAIAAARVESTVTSHLDEVVTRSDATVAAQLEALIARLTADAGQRVDDVVSGTNTDALTKMAELTNRANAELTQCLEKLRSGADASLNGTLSDCDTDARRRVAEASERVERAIGSVENVASQLEGTVQRVAQEAEARCRTVEEQARARLEQIYEETRLALAEPEPPDEVEVEVEPVEPVEPVGEVEPVEVIAEDPVVAEEPTVESLEPNEPEHGADPWQDISGSRAVADEDDGFFSRLAEEVSSTSVGTPSPEVDAPSGPLPVPAGRPVSVSVLESRRVRAAVPLAMLATSVRRLRSAEVSQLVRIELRKVAPESSQGTLRLTVFDPRGWWDVHDVPLTAPVEREAQAVVDLTELDEALSEQHRFVAAADATMVFDHDVEVGNILLLARHEDQLERDPMEGERVERLDLSRLGLGEATSAGVTLETQVGRVRLPASLTGHLRRRRVQEADLVIVDGESRLLADVQGVAPEPVIVQIVGVLEHPGLDDSSDAAERRTRDGSVAELVTAVSATTTPEELVKILEVGVGYTRRKAAAHPALPPEVIDELLRDGTESMRAAAASNQGLSAEASATAAGDASAAVRASVAANPAIPETCLEELARDTVAHVRARAASNPIARSELLEELANDEDPSVRAAVASQASTPGPTLSVLVRDPDPIVGAAVARNPSCPPELLTELLGVAPEAVLANPGAAKSFLIAGSVIDIPHLRAAVATNRTTPARQLRDLSRDEEIEVLRAVAEHPNAPAGARRRARRRLMERLSREGS